MTARPHTPLLAKALLRGLVIGSTPGRAAAVLGRGRGHAGVVLQCLAAALVLGVVQDVVMIADAGYMAEGSPETSRSKSDELLVVPGSELGLRKSPSAGVSESANSMNVFFSLN
eukprot:CAMPEP_0168467586 /NCGR_PEP_ID=MMETSP0228-20121227/57259_1 /TAXON_ID=133427 /ORGANISM="Protoceratium reticulatum, Strain CCCM 535 (=CCMP 1889)" /LENGTH=113 /DNA_ID=CAMNT_0008483301 /DNA_START=332 /DNA_END=672 /DNA_ORIENTATION=+